MVSGVSSKMTGEEQAFRLGQAWEAMPEPKRQFVFQVVRADSRWKAIALVRTRPP